MSWDDGERRGGRWRIDEKGREEQSSAGDLLAGSTVGAVRTGRAALLQPRFVDML